tara:strand:- start:1613 stop:1819 length:207 start_codon:yes stop_codon:yes gene_type:complete
LEAAEAVVPQVVVEVLEDFLKHQELQFQLHHIQLLLGLEVVAVQQVLIEVVQLQHQQQQMVETLLDFL